MAHTQIPSVEKTQTSRNMKKALETKDMIGIIPNTGDSVEEIRQIRKELSSQITSFEDLEKLEKEILRP